MLIPVSHYLPTMAFTLDIQLMANSLCETCLQESLVALFIKTNIQSKMMNTLQYTFQLFVSYRREIVYPESAGLFENNTNISKDFRKRLKSSEVQDKAMVSYLKFPTLWVTLKGLFWPNFILHTIAEEKIALTFPVSGHIWL